MFPFARASLWGYVFQILSQANGPHLRRSNRKPNGPVAWDRENSASLLGREDSPQLSSMLLRTQRRGGGLRETALLDFFHEADRARVSEQLRSSTCQSAVALNADMLDSDFNRVKVELICVQFDNLTSERPWVQINYSQCNQVGLCSGCLGYRGDMAHCQVLPGGYS